MKFLTLQNGLPRLQTESGTPTIYDESLKVVSGTAGTGEINVDDVQTGDAITLPNSGSYSNLNLEVYLNGNRLEDVLDYNILSTTQFSLTFDGAVGDIIRMRIDRGA